MKSYFWTLLLLMFIPAATAAADDGLVYRSDLVRAVVEMNGGVLSVPPTIPSFDDVARNDRAFAYAEEAAKEGWILGDHRCYGTHPCFFRPDEPMTRAEAAHFLISAFRIPVDTTLAEPLDHKAGYPYEHVRTAVSTCLLKQDQTSRVRPDDFITQGEVFDMLYRIDSNLAKYTQGCTLQERSSPLSRSEWIADWKKKFGEFRQVTIRQIGSSSSSSSSSSSKSVRCSLRQGATLGTEVTIEVIPAVPSCVFGDYSIKMHRGAKPQSRINAQYSITLRVRQRSAFTITATIGGKKKTIRIEIPADKKRKS